MRTKAWYAGGGAGSSAGSRMSWCGCLVVSAFLVAMLSMVGGCYLEGTGPTGLYRHEPASSSGGPVEVHWYTPPGEGPIDVTPTGKIDSWVRSLKVWCLSDTPSHTDKHERQGNFTVTTFYPGHAYDFEYLVPHRQEKLVYGQLWVNYPGYRCGLGSRDWATKFVRHCTLMVNPTWPQGETGHASILTDADIDRALAGDVVEKVVFVADLAAVEGRIAMIDREIRRLEDKEARLVAQEEYWSTKRSDRRHNALYAGDYGEDIPGMHLAMYQVLLGPETYHWKRYSEADDRMRTYQEEIATLRRPFEKLREERSALRAMLASAHVLYRRGDMMLMSYTMTRRYHEPTDEITRSRATLDQDPRTTLNAPYWFSELAHVTHWPHLFSLLGAYPRLLLTKNRVDTIERPIGDIVLVMRVGPRELWPIKKTSRIPVARSLP